MKSVILHCEANVELTAAAKQYHCQRPALAQDFLQAFRLAQRAVAEEPDRFSYLEKPVRRCRLSGFPYKLVYEELADCVHVLAVMHDSRDPGYWKNRTS